MCRNYVITWTLITWTKFESISNNYKSFRTRLKKCPSSGGVARQAAASRCLHTTETLRSCIIQKRRQIQINRHEINTNRLNGATAVGGAQRHKYRPRCHKSSDLWPRLFWTRDAFHRLFCFIQRLVSVVNSLVNCFWWIKTSSCFIITRH